MPKVTHTRTWVSDLVRSGLLDDDTLQVEVAEAIRADHPEVEDPEDVARSWVAEAARAWRDEAARWPLGPTDHDRLSQVFDELGGSGFVVLQGCPDHWSARDAAGGAERGVLWFTPSDVWHAIEEGMLEVNLWHPTTANAAPGEGLLDEVLAAFHDRGLSAHFAEGRIEVQAFWHRRPTVR